MKIHPLIVLGLGCVAACSDPKATPDAGVTPDSDTTVDAPPADAAMPDAAPTCPEGQLCMQMMPIDGVTNLPAGRLAIAWLSEEGPNTLEIAYDVPWTAAPVTMVDLTQITPPTAAFQQPVPLECEGALFAGALAVLSTDPDGDGAISAEEILNGEADFTVYGIHQEVVAWFNMACPAELPDFPEGFLEGIHVYSADTPVQHLDGTVTMLQTCQPGTAICDNLSDPF